MISSTKNPKVAAAARLRKRDVPRRRIAGSSSRARRGFARRSPRTRRRSTSCSSTTRCTSSRSRARERGVEVVHAAGAVLGTADLDRHSAGDRRCGALRRRRARDAPGLRMRRRACTRSATRGTRARSSGRPTPPARDAVVFGAASVDVYNPKTVRACAGSIFHLPIVRDVADDRRDPARCASSGHRILAMDAHGSHSLYTTDVSGPVAFVFGNEAHGLPQERRRRRPTRRCACRTPGAAESLNLAAAATICLFEHARRRGEQGRVPRDADRRRRARHPLAPHGDEGVRLRAREALARHDRRATGSDAHRDRPRRRPDGSDPAPARGRGAGLRRHARALPRPVRRRRARRLDRRAPAPRSRTPRDRLDGRSRARYFLDPVAAEDRGARLRRVAGLVGGRRSDHDRRRGARRRRSS